MGTLHCLNIGFGDASVIIADKATFLIDCHNIAEFHYLLPSNKQLRGVFISHQHSDHYSGLSYLKEKGYSIDHLIFSPYNRRYDDSSVSIEEWNEFNYLKDSFQGRGTELHSPFSQKSLNDPWWDTNGIKFWIIGPSYNIANSDTREIHDASLVIYTKLENKSCLFAGDASDISLEYIANNTNNYCNGILHASHHGSLNGAHLEFIKGCNANHTLISTKSGVHENVPHPTALQRYKEQTKYGVYRTDINGNCKWDF